MKSYVLTIMAAAIVAAAAATAAMMAAAPAITAQNHRAGGRKPLLDKTWTTGVQENKEGSQAFVNQVLTSPVSFQAEGTGIEPATPFGAPHFQCGR